MKLIILTSSIFYLLGLKLTHQVEIEKPFNTDSVTVTAPVEKPKLPEVNADEKDLPLLDDGKADSIQQIPTGSNEQTAPWIPPTEEVCTKN